MLSDALGRLLGRLRKTDDAVHPELLELDRRADVAMTACTCGHVWHLHEHPHLRTACDRCPCPRFRPAQR